MRVNSWLRIARVSLVIFSLSLFGAITLQAQNPQASISGVVSDPSGAVIPGATVKVTDTMRGVSYQAETNQTGVYVIKYLTPSTYRVTAEKSGFQTYVVDAFPLTTLQAAVLNITMKVGATRTQMVVSSQVQMVEPSNATLGGLVNNAAIVDLPLVGRNVLTLMALQPGVAPSTPNSFSSTFFTNGVRYSINGGLESTSDFELDGISLLNQSDIPGIYGVSVTPSVESIDQMRVQTNDFSAAYGHSGGGITTMTTKSGTNAFHGSAFDFLRNDALNANSFFSNRSGGKKAPFRYNDFGGSVGGPIQKNKTFFFTTYERYINHGGGFALRSVPTPEERNGDFSHLYNSKGQLITIYNPFSVHPDPNNPGSYLRDVFPQNIITPTTLINTVAKNAMGYFPAPNLPGEPIPGTSLYQPVDNYGATSSTSSPTWMSDTRVDHIFSETKRAFIRYDYLNSVYGASNIYGNVADNSLGAMTVTGHNAVVGYTQSFGSSAVLELRLGFNRFKALRPSVSLGFDPAQLGLPSSLTTYQASGNVLYFPNFTMQGYSSLGAGSGPYYQSANQDWIGSANYSQVMGKHTVTAGFEGVLYFLNFFQSNPFSAHFTNGMTQGPDPLAVSSTAGDGFASFLLGTGTGGSISYGPKRANANHYFGEYVEDSFKFTPKLTVNVGFRLEEETATTERFNRMVAIDPSAVNPISQDVGFDVYGGYLFAGGSLGRRAIRPMEWKPNPRLGIAYSLNDKTVIRAGYGIFYSLTHSGATDAYTGGAFSTSTPWLASLDSGIHVNTTLDNPFPQGYNYPQGSSNGLATNTGASLNGGWPQSLVTPYIQQWNFTIQRSITTNTMLQVAYAGSKGTHLGAFECCGGVTMNQLPPQDLAQYGLPYQSDPSASPLLTQVNNPFYGYITVGGALSQPTVQGGQLMRPFPEWQGVQPTNAGWGNSTYHALQVTFSKRLVNGSSFIAGYTWSKVISDIVDGRWNDAIGGYGSGGIRSWYCFSCEKAVSSYDVPHRFVFSYEYELPFGAGKKFGSAWNGVTNAVLGGWQANGILTLANGMPLRIAVSQNTSYSFGGFQRPDLVGNPVLSSGQGLAEWFNTDAFAQPANFTFGSVGRTVTAVRTDWTRDLDFSLFKNFKLTERVKLQFRAETFNLTNTPIFGGPNTTLGSSAFGVVSGQSNSPRNIQMALKLLF